MCCDLAGASLVAKLSQKLAQFQIISRSMLLLSDRGKHANVSIIRHHSNTIDVNNSSLDSTWKILTGKNLRAHLDSIRNRLSSLCFHKLVLTICRVLIRLAFMDSHLSRCSIMFGMKQVSLPQWHDVQTTSVPMPRSRADIRDEVSSDHDRRLWHVDARIFLDICSSTF